MNLSNWLHALALALAVLLASPAPVEAASSRSKKAALKKKKAKKKKVKKKVTSRSKKAKQRERERELARQAEEEEESDAEESESDSDSRRGSRSSALSSADEEESLPPVNTRPTDRVRESGDESTRAVAAADRDVFDPSAAFGSSGGSGATGGGNEEIARPMSRPSSSDRGSRPYALQIAAGPKAFGRSLAWNDDIEQRMIGYSVMPAMALGVTGNWFPMEHFSDSFLANFGVTGSFDMAVGLGTRGADNTVYPTQASGYDVGVKFRLPFQGWHAGAVAALGSQTFAITYQGERTSLPPDVGYGFIRAGVFGGFFLLSSLEVGLHFDYLLVNATGMIGTEDYFPRASAAGIDVGASIDYHFSKAFGVGLAGGLRRYGFDMHSQPTDLNVAGGAVDSYPTFQLRLIYEM